MYKKYCFESRIFVEYTIPLVIKAIEINMQKISTSKEVELEKCKRTLITHTAKHA